MFIFLLKTKVGTKWVYVSAKERQLNEHKEACEKLFIQHLPHDELFSELARYIPDFNAIIDLPARLKVSQFLC
ncbi:hypothetical protein P9304_17035 [Priestia flexa]|uniref:hypothetical protein n=1 Tax=Priestia flexa TaxID=86664 RepID=UPI00077C67E9|nr:hypothetical protein [Priestia flexa]MED4590385.1 hypothetical protein [Priestia flexa]